MATVGFQMVAFSFKMPFFGLKRLSMLQIVSFLGGLVEPPLVWPLSLLNGPLPHKDFNRKIAAVILKKNEAQILRFAILAILKLKIAILSVQMTDVCNFCFRLTIFSFKMLFFWLEKAVYATNCVFFGGSCGAPPGLAPFSVKWASPT